MIFGFNTDIRHDDTVYHVQSEAREGEQLLQTQVFVRGRCIGKRAISWTAAAAHAAQNASAAPAQSDPSANSGAVADPNQSPNQSKDQDKEKLLRDLHREVLDAIRDGRLESVLDKRDPPEVLAAIKELDLQWTNAGSIHTGGTLMMNLRVTESGQPVQGARLTFRLARPGSDPYYAQVLSDAQGNAEMSVQVNEDALSDSSVLVQANFQGRTATRKFQIQRA
ncbi:MAG: hypothetical protein WBV46_00090 [Terriglobales bacterium]|jgi:hypothetical protein